MPKTKLYQAIEQTLIKLSLIIFMLMKKSMRDRMERFLVLPFPFGCASKVSVELEATTRDKRSQDHTTGPSLAVTRRRAGEERSPEIMKNSSGFLADLSKSNIAGGIRRLICGIKRLSQLFLYKEDAEEMEHEMEIGYPTDVKHLTHIGLDGSTNTNHVMGWDNLKVSDQFLSLSTISFEQFELAMAAQAQQPLATDPS